MARVHIALGSLPVVAFDVRGTMTIGSADTCDVVLPLPDVAERHAELTEQPDGLALAALDNETVLVNGRPVKSAALGASDVVSIGSYTMRVASLGQSSPHPFSTITEDGRATLGPAPRRVLVAEGPDAGRALCLDQPVTLVGRSSECDLVLDDARVSARHVAIERVPDGVRVRDLGSRNGTLLGGERIESARVGVGARVTLGRTVLVLAGLEDGPASEAGREPGHASESEPEREPGLAEMIGSGAAMQSVYRALRAAARSTLPVLVTGETGTGKELAARAVHVLGERTRMPFVPVNTAAIPRDLVESELFGHRKGAFTGAVGDHKGAFARAHGGTLFLDEIGELPLELQAKLLRALESGEFTPLGHTVLQKSDARIVAATNRDLRAAIDAGTFREDLYFRIAVLRIRLPRLAERREDVRELVHAFLRAAERDTGVRGASRVKIAAPALAALEAHDWPGNVRELRNVVHRAVVLAPDGTITRALVEELLADAPLRPPRAGTGTLEEIERAAILNCLKDTGDNKRAAARRLGIALSTLYEKLKRYES